MHASPPSLLFTTDVARPTVRTHNSCCPQSAGDIITYPDLYFTVDSFDEAFDECELGPRLSFSLELMAQLGPVRKSANDIMVVSTCHRVACLS